jgi:hypothetical protein
MHLGSPSLASESIGCTHSIYIISWRRSCLLYHLSATWLLADFTTTTTWKSIPTATTTENYYGKSLDVQAWHEVSYSDFQKYICYNSATTTTLYFSIKIEIINVSK